MKNQSVAIESKNNSLQMNKRRAGNLLLLLILFLVLICIFVFVIGFLLTRKIMLWLLVAILIVLCLKRELKKH